MTAQRVISHIEYTSERSGMRAGGSRYRDPLLCATLFPSHHSSLIFFSRRLNLTHLDVLSKVRAPPKSSPLTLQSVPDRQ